MLRDQELTEKLLANSEHCFSTCHGQIYFVGKLCQHEARVKGTETQVEGQSLAVALAEGASLNQSSHTSRTWRLNDRGIFERNWMTSGVSGVREKRRWISSPGEQLSSVPSTEPDTGESTVFTRKVWDGRKDWVNSQQLLSSTHVSGLVGLMIWIPLQWFLPLLSTCWDPPPQNPRDICIRSSFCACFLQVGVRHWHP